MKVYVLHISHRHGDDIHVHTTDTSANIDLARYCEEWWEKEVLDEEGNPLPMPSEPGDVISIYFERVHFEHAQIFECDVLDLD